MIPRPWWVLILFVASTQSVPAAPKAELWEHWTAHDASSTSTIDHRMWDLFLKAYTTPGPRGVTRVAYGAVDARGKAALDGYIRSLAATPISRYSRDEQLAYWINLYNALTVDVVLDNFPLASIKDIDISPGLFSSGPWGKKLIVVEGEEIALDDIEHRILRPIWRDPRIHYAVNCASVGCPNLQKTAFTGANADALLDAAAEDYINHPRGSRIANGRLIVSSIYEWFQEDFGGDEAGVIEHLKRYARPELKSALAQVSDIGGDEYDWTLNDTDANTTAAMRVRRGSLSR